MKYTVKELAALVHLAVTMSQIDGNTDNIEKHAITSGLTRLGVDAADASDIFSKAVGMNAAEALSVVTAFSDEQKKAAACYLAKIMASNGEMTDAEMKLWKLICRLGSFPQMKISEALSLLSNH